MATEIETALAERCWVEDRRIWVALTGDRVFSFPASRYPRLASATDADLALVSLRVGGRALRWEMLDEDIWIDDALHGRYPSVSRIAA